MRTALALLVLAFPFTLSSPPAEAAVVCKRAGWPKGCVPASTAAAVVYCTAPGVPVGCVARPATVGAGAPGVGVRAGVPGNRGGPVNRVGRR